jgi:protein involved in polysaccharide export with SLBB domain
MGALAFAGCHTAPPQPEYAEIPDLPGTPIGVSPNAGGTDNASTAASSATSAAPADVTPAPVSPAPASSGSDVQPVAAAPTSKSAPSDDSRPQDAIKVGETLDIVYSDTPTPLQPAHELVRDDGTITLMFDKSFHAAGKTQGELSREIRKAYVPDYFQQLTVSITRPEKKRVIYVDGEVKAPTRIEYGGAITLTQAINSAGGFTDFANRRHVRLIRANGKIEIINCNKLLEHPENDPEVNPGDRIVVPRSIL